MAACFCTGQCRVTGICGGEAIDPWSLFRGPYYCEIEPWKGPKMPSTAEPSVEPEPSRTAPKPRPNDDPSRPTPSPLAGSWQCGGCGTIYSMFVTKCECQKRTVTTTGNSTAIDPKNFFGTFTADWQNPPLTCADVGCKCGEKDEARH